MVWGRVAANGTGNLLFIDGILKKYTYLYTYIKRESKTKYRKIRLINTFLLLRHTEIYIYIYIHTYICPAF